MFKLSRMTDYGVVLLCYMAQRSDARSTAPELAERTGLPAPTVSKILKALTKADILSATRGAQGGYAIARAPESVTVAQIIAALDGPVALTACVDGSDDNCAVEQVCPMAGSWNRINKAVKSALSDVTLAELVDDCCSFPDAPPDRALEPSQSVTAG